MKINTIPSYYFVVIALLLLQAIFTVYQGGLMVGTGGQITQLEKQKRQIQAETQVLSQLVTQHHSLINIQASEQYDQFQPITNVDVILTSNSVALR